MSTTTTQISQNGTTANVATGATAPDEEPSMTTSKLADAAHRAVDTAAGQIADAEAKLRTQAADKEQTLRDAADTATVKASELRDRTQEFINKNPMAAAGIAFTAGILFSAWMRR